MRIKNNRKSLFDVTPYLFLIPVLVAYTAFVVWPSINTFYFSVFRIDGIAINVPRTFVGLDNYRRMLIDPLFHAALLHNMYWMCMALIIPIGLALFIAVLLSRPSVRARNLFRTIFFLPQVLAIVVVGLIWSWMLNPRYGPINMVLKGIGLEALAVPWLGDYTFALPSLFVAYTWAYYGFCMVIFLAALQSIDENLYDAAKVDGANALQQFINVTLPGLRHAFTTIILVTMINSFKIFDLIRVMTNGGPGNSTYVLSFLLYSKVFYADDVGYGACVAAANTFIIVVISAAYLQYRRRVEKVW